MWKQWIFFSLLMAAVTSSILIYAKLLSTPSTIFIELRQSINIKNEQNLVVRQQMNQSPKDSPVSTPLNDTAVATIEKCKRQLRSSYNGTSDEIKKFVGSQCRGSSQCIPETSNLIHITLIPVSYTHLTLPTICSV